MIMIVVSFALVKFYAFAILYVLIVMQIKVVVVVVDQNDKQPYSPYIITSTGTNSCIVYRRFHVNL